MSPLATPTSSKIHDVTAVMAKKAAVSRGPSVYEACDTLNSTRMTVMVLRPPGITGRATSAATSGRRTPS